MSRKIPASPEAVKLYESGMSLKELSERFGVGDWIIRTWVRRLGGKIRRMGAPCGPLNPNWKGGFWVDDPKRARKKYLARRKIKPEEYENKFIQQGRRCKICRTSQSKRWHWDHDHKTGKLRDILCNKCNLGLGLFNDSPEILKKAARYLEKFL
jgi:transposase-like protein